MTAASLIAFTTGVAVFLASSSGGCTRHPTDAPPRPGSVSPVARQQAEQEFVLAAWRGDLAAVRRAIASGVDVNARFGGPATAFTGPDGGWPMAGARWTALIAAANQRHLDIVRALISAGAGLNLDDGHGGTALAHAVDVYTRDRQVDDVAVILIKAGADVNTKTGVYIDGPSGETPLHRAAAWNQQRAVAALIAAGADVNATQGHGETPLDYALSCKSTESAHLLRAAGGRSTRH